MCAACRLSIVIPVYNTGGYLAACINSCLNQDIPADKYEIILVNDGSTDDSMELIEEYCSIYPNVRSHSQRNCGLSVARNVGLDLASGDYVWFVDSDDAIRGNCLGSLLDYVDGADVLAFGPMLHRHRMSGRDYIVATKANFRHGAPYYIFRRQFLTDNALRFYPGIYHEDSEFTPRVLYCAESLVVCTDECYCRTARADSITQTMDIRRAYDLIFVARRLEDFIKTGFMDFTLRKMMLKLLPVIVNSSLNVASKSDPSQWEAYCKRFIFYRTSHYYLISRDPRYIAEGILLSFSANPIKTYIRILKCIKR